MNTYDIYVKSLSAPATVVRSRSWNPDDAIQRARDRGDYIPEKGDRVVRCVEVDRFDGPQGKMNAGGGN